MPVDPVTRQQLLELIYDLLAEPQAAELRRQIQSDPELAEAYAEARRTAGLLGDAARLEAPKVDLRRAQRTPEVARGRSARGRSSPWARGANWAVSVAAAVLLAFSLGGYFYHRQELADLAANHIRLLATGPSRLQSGMANTYTVDASTVTGAPIATKVQLALYSPSGQPLLRQEEDTDAQGRAQVSVPANLALPAAARLEVSAVYRNKRESLSADLRVAPVGFAAHVEADRPWYRPGDTARLRAVVLARFSLSADRDLPVQLSVVDPSGSTLAGFPRTARTERGVAQSQWVIPGALAAGTYTLVVRSPEGLFAPQSHRLTIRAQDHGELDKQLEFCRPAYRSGDTVVASFAARRRDGQPAAGARIAVVATVDGATIYQASPAPLADGRSMIRFPLPASIASGKAQLAVTVVDGGRSETLVRPIPAASSKLDVRFRPEGGPLVAGLRNRVYFAAADSAGRPVELRGVIVDSRDQEVSELETVHAGMGSFSFTPAAGEQYRARILAPAGATEEPALPEVAGEPKVVLTTGPGVFAAGKPLEFEVDSLRGGLPLVAAASCRGVLVGQQALVTNDQEPRNKASLSLVPQASGAIRLTVYEYRGAQPRAVAERLVYRHPERRLQLAIRNGQHPYLPGQEVKLSVRASNEKGDPVQALLGIAALADDTLTGSPELTLPADFYFDGQVAGVTAPNLYMAEDPKAATALDLLLGSQMRPSVPRLSVPAGQLFAAMPAPEQAQAPAVLDNLGQLRAEYEKNLASYRAERTKALNTLTTLSFFGGLGLVLLVAMLAALKVVSGIRLWVPAFAAAIACLLVGATLMNPDRFQPGLGAAVAYVPFRGPTELAMDTKSVAPAENAPSESKLADKPAAEAKSVPAGAPRMERAAAGLRQQEVEEAQQGGAPARAWSGPRSSVKDAVKHFAPQMRSFGFGAAPAAPAPAPAAAAPVPADRVEPLRPLRKKTARSLAGVGPEQSPPVWIPALETNAQGEAQLALQLPAAGAYRLRVDGHGSGRLGHAERVFEAQVPCQLDPKVSGPLSLGDQLDLPLVVANPTGAPASVSIALKQGVQLKLHGSASRTLELKPGESRREQFRVDAVGLGRCELEFVGSAGPHSRRIERSLDVTAPGYPTSRVANGRLRGAEMLSVDLPEWLPGSLEVSLCVLPTLLAELELAYEALESGPNGCAEQPAAEAWLSAMALDWIQRNHSAGPEVVRRWRERLDASRARLARYEAPPRGFGGYQWFGAHPATDSLSALVLAALDDVRRSAGTAPGDDQLAAWLRARLEPNGAPRQDPTSAAAAVTEVPVGLIAWALARHDPKSAEAQRKQFVAGAAKSDDATQWALAAGALLAAGAKSETASLVDRLTAAQRDDGRLEGKQSIFNGRDHAAAVETTALGAIVWLQAGRSLPAERAVTWLAGVRRADGGFGTPLATALVLRAMAEQAQARPAETKSGKLSLRNGDALVAEHDLSADQQGPIVLTGLESHFRPGKNALSVSLASVGTLGYSLRVRMATAKPLGPAGPITLATRLESPRVRVGQTMGLAVEVANPSEQAAPLVVALIGLPAGLEPRGEQLQQLKKQAAVDQFAIGPRQVALYWRTMSGRQKIALRLELVASASGRFQGPASMGYLYHSPDARSYAAPLALEVAP